MILLSAIAIFVALLGINYTISRSALYPPVVFTATWLLLLIGVLASGNSLYEIGPTTYLVYILGATAFSLGGVGGLAIVGKMKRHTPSPALQISWPGIPRAMDVLIVILVAGLPVYWNEVASLAGDVEKSLLLQNIRQKTVELSNDGGGLSPIANLVVLAQFVAVVAFYEAGARRSDRFRAAIAIALALLYGGMSGTKGNAVTLLLTLYFVYALKTGEVRMRPLILTVAGTLTFFSVGLMFVNFAGASTDVSEIASMIARTTQNYLLGSLVAFDRLVQDPNLIESTQPIHRFFIETARSLGLAVSVPPLHATYTDISPYMDSNTYTIYFAYFKDHGWAGTAVIMTGLGLGMSALYGFAAPQNPVATLLYAKLCVAMVLSLNADHFFNGLNSHIKAAIFFFVIYHVIARKGRSAIRSEPGA